MLFTVFYERSMNTCIFPLGSVSPLVAKCPCSQFCSEAQTRKISYPDLPAVLLTMFDADHIKSKRRETLKCCMNQPGENAHSDPFS